MLARGAVRLPARGLAALPTRKQLFKSHIAALREQDPDRWTALALARHFEVPVENVRAMLALQSVEAERARAAPLDPELLQLAEDAEEYLDSEYAESAPRPAAEAKALPDETFYDSEAPPGEGLGRLSLEQDTKLVAAVAARFGAAGAASLPTAIRDAVGDLTVYELAQLTEGVGGAAPEGEVDRGALLRGLLGSLTGANGIPAALAGGEPLDLAAHESLGLETVPPLTPPAARARAAPAAAEPPAATEFWVDGSRRAGIIHDEPSSPSLYQPARTRAELRSATTDSADKLQANLDARHRHLNGLNAGTHAPWRNEGRIIFTEVSTPKRGVTLASKVWVTAKPDADGGVGATREPTPDEHRQAVLRVQPPILKPRIWRNR